MNGVPEEAIVGGASCWTLIWHETVSTITRPFTFSQQIKRKYEFVCLLFFLSGVCESRIQMTHPLTWRALQHTVTWNTASFENGCETRPTLLSTYSMFSRFFSWFIKVHLRRKAHTYKYKYMWLVYTKQVRSMTTSQKLWGAFQRWLLFPPELETANYHWAITFSISY